MVEYGNAELAAEKIYLQTLDECVKLSDDDLFFFYSCDEPVGDENGVQVRYEKGHSISIPCETMGDVFQVAYVLLDALIKSVGEPGFDVEKFLEIGFKEQDEDSKNGGDE